MSEELRSQMSEIVESLHNTDRRVEALESTMDWLRSASVKIGVAMLMGAFGIIGTGATLIWKTSSVVADIKNISDRVQQMGDVSQMRADIRVLEKEVERLRDERDDRSRR